MSSRIQLDDQKLLCSNLYYLVKRDSSQKEVAEKLNITRQTVSNYLNNKHIVPQHIIDSLTIFLNVNESDLYKRDFKKEDLSGTLQQTTVQPYQISTIVQIPVVRDRVEAGYLFLPEQRRLMTNNIQYIDIPRVMLKGVHPSEAVGFEVLGDSMYPTLKQSEIVLAKKLDTSLPLVNYIGKAVIIITRDNMLCKRIAAVYEKGIEFKSDNKQYTNQKMAYDEILSLYHIFMAVNYDI